MIRIPTVHGDANTWGQDLVDYLNATNGFLPQNFGALADGSSDDTAAVQLALDAAATLGGNVFLSAGNWKWSSVNAYTNVDIIGAGTSATLVNITSTDSPGIVLEAPGDMPCRAKFKNFSMSGPPGSTAPAVRVGSLTDGSPCYGFTMDNLYITNFAIGTHLHGCFMTEVNHCEWWNCSGDGLWLDGGTISPVAGTWQTSITVRNCYSNGNGGYGYHLNKITYSTLIDCAADNCAEGYYGYDLRDVAFIACGAESPDDPERQVSVGTQPIGFHMTGESTVGTSNVLLNNCYSYAITEKPFWFENYVSNSTMMNCSQLTPEGISPLTAGNGLIIGATCTLTEINCALPDGMTVADGAKNMMIAPATAVGDPAGLQFDLSSPKLFPWKDSIQIFAAAATDVPVTILHDPSASGAFLQARKSNSTPGDGGPQITMQPYGQGQIQFGTDEAVLIERPPSVDYLSFNKPPHIPFLANVSSLNSTYPAGTHYGCIAIVNTDRGARFVISDGTNWTTPFIPASGYNQPVTQAQTDGY